jgi:hypothetical protein
MEKMSRLDAACVALGVAIMDEWDKLKDGQEIVIKKVNGFPGKENLIGFVIREIMHLEEGQLVDEQGNPIDEEI